MKIRRPRDDADVSGIIRVRGLGWREAYGHVLPDSVLRAQTVDPTAADVERWADGLGGERAEVFVAVVGVDEAGDEAVGGFVDMRWDNENTKPFVGADEAGLRAIYVDPERWGEGIGTALLERALDALPDRIDAVRLEAFVDNEIGRRFYEARGFEHTDTTDREIAGETYRTAVYTRPL